MKSKNPEINTRVTLPDEVYKMVQALINKFEKESNFRHSNASMFRHVVRTYLRDYPIEWKYLDAEFKYRVFIPPTEAQENVMYQRHPLYPNDSFDGGRVLRERYPLEVHTIEDCTIYRIWFFTERENGTDWRDYWKRYGTPKEPMKAED